MQFCLCLFHFKLVFTTIPVFLTSAMLLKQALLFHPLWAESSAGMASRLASRPSGPLILPLRNHCTHGRNASTTPPSSAVKLQSIQTLSYMTTQWVVITTSLLQIGRLNSEILNSLLPLVGGWTRTHSSRNLALDLVGGTVCFGIRWTISLHRSPAPRLELRNLSVVPLL